GGAANQLRSALTVVRLISTIAVVCLLGTACRTPQQSTTADDEGRQTESMAQELRDKAARFAPVDLIANVDGLPSHERQALAKLVQAAKVLDALYLRQVWAGNEAMLLDLVR